MQINQLTSRQIKQFHSRMEADLGVRFMHSGPLAWLLRKGYDRTLGRFLPMPDSLYNLRPFCFKNWIFLPYSPGCDKVGKVEQIMIAVHECTHSLRLRVYPGTSAEWYGCYFTDDAFRGMEETPCKEAESDLRYWLFGIQKTLDLSGYLLTRGTTFLCERAFDKAQQQTLKQGRGWQKHKAAATAMRILISMGVERTK